MFKEENVRSITLRFFAFADTLTMASGISFAFGLQCGRPRSAGGSGSQFAAIYDAEMTRGDIEKLLASGKKPDLSDKGLNGLDLSGLDLSGVNSRAARLDRTKLVGARLSGAIFDQVWGIGTDFSGADLTHASLFSAQMQKTNFNNADLSYARIAADFSRATMRKACLVWKFRIAIEQICERLSHIRQIGPGMPHNRML